MNSTHNRLKLQFPKFTGDDLTGWIYQAEQYIDFQRSISISEFISPRFISKVLHYNGIVRSLKLPDPCPGLTSPRHCYTASATLTLTARLKHSHAIGKQPRWAFCRLWNSYLLGCYVAGLKDEIHLDVKSKNPWTLPEAIGVTRLIK